MHLNVQGITTLILSTFFVYIFGNTLLYQTTAQHQMRNVILKKFGSLAAPEVVILTTCCATNDENYNKIASYPFLYR